LADGSKLVVQTYTEPGTGKTYKNWIMTCPHHTGCSRARRVTRAFTARHGLLEPIAYLCCWRDVHLAPDRRHTDRRTQPTKETIDAWMAANGGSFCTTYLIDLASEGAIL
jgi:hypothetical protein